MTTHAEAAERLRDLWSPYCERLEIAGSIRRGKSDPHDIELVAVPKIRSENRQVDMFTVDMVEVDLLSNALEDKKAQGNIVDRLDKNGRPAWGPRFKRLLYHGFPVDVFIVRPPAQWGVIFAIRTGPAEFSHRFVTSRSLGGAMPADMRVKDGQLLHGGQVVETPEEEDFFEAIGLPCWPPSERTLAKLSEWQRRPS